MTAHRPSTLSRMIAAVVLLAILSLTPAPIVSRASLPTPGNPLSILAMNVTSQSNENNSKEANSMSYAAPSATTWSKTYGGSGYYGASSVAPTSDGGYLVLASIESISAGATDVWVFKLDSSGNILWQKAYRGGYNDPRSIAPTSDGGYIVAGSTSSIGPGPNGARVFKLNSSGEITWQKIYGGSNGGVPNSIVPISDGGYVVAGSTESDGVLTTGEAWVFKLSGSGDIMWQKTYGGSSTYVAESIAPTSDGGYIVAGWSGSSPGVFSNKAWVFKLNGSGEVIWQKAFERSEANSIATMNDGGYIIAGTTNSFGGSYGDAWVLKLNGSGEVMWQNAYRGSKGGKANSIVPTSDGGSIVAGYTNSFGAGARDAWVFKFDSSGEIVWQKAYGGSGQDSVWSIAATGDGGAAAVGSTSSFGANSGAWVIKVDADGNLGGTCSIVRNSSAVAVTSASTVSNTSVTLFTTMATEATSNVTVNDTAAQVATQCGSGPTYTVFLPSILKPVSRSMTDRADDVSGYQIHVMYVLPSDGTDRQLDINSTLNTSVAAFQRWLVGQTGGPRLRLDTYQGLLDITFYRLSRSNQEIANYGAFVREQIEVELSSAGFNQPNKIYAVYYDGLSTFACGGGAWPPELVGNVAALYLQGVVGSIQCNLNQFASSENSPGYWEFSMIHEIFHTLGAVATCAPNQTLRGHVSDSNTDLMYAGSQPWNPSVLDIGRDDYYGHNDPNCLDVARSVFIEPLPPNAVKPPGWP